MKQRYAFGLALILLGTSQVQAQTPRENLVNASYQEAERQLTAFVTGLNILRTNTPLLCAAAAQPGSDFAELMKVQFDTLKVVLTVAANAEAPLQVVKSFDGEVGVQSAEQGRMVIDKGLVAMQMAQDLLERCTGKRAP